MQLPGALILYGCFLVAGAAATAVWSLVQVLLDRGPVRSRTVRRSRGSVQAHLTRAVTASAVVLLVASVPSLLSHAQLAATVLELF